jgi:hypothetical protein
MYDLLPKRLITAGQSNYLEQKNGIENPGIFLDQHRKSPQESGFWVI